MSAKEDNEHVEAAEVSEVEKSEAPPRGTRDKRALEIDAIFDDAAPALVRQLVEQALKGDKTALRLCAERLPPRAERAVVFKLPPIAGMADAAKASSAVLAACSNGTLSPIEATRFMGMIESHVRIVEVTEIEERLSALEKRQSDEQKSTTISPRAA